MKIDMTLFEEHPTAKNNWKALKNRVGKEVSQLVTNFNRLKTGKKVISKDNNLPPKKNNGDT